MKIYTYLVFYLFMHGNLHAQNESAVSPVEDSVTDESNGSSQAEDSTEQIEKNDTFADDNNKNEEDSNKEIDDIDQDEFDKEKSSENQIVVKVEIPKQIQVNSESGFKLSTPWAPKPMQKAPRGWRYVPGHPDSSYAIDVNLNVGKKLSLHVIPYVLVPEMANNVIQVREPGYQPVRGYKQLHSVSAIISETTASLKLAGDSLDESIENLSALVDSLPK